jgi:hypothetical protein
MANNFPSSDESLHRLHRSGWSIGETAVLTADGRQFWLVSGTNGENAICAQAGTVDEAWWRAVQQAEAVGMIGRGETQGATEKEGWR